MTLAEGTSAESVSGGPESLQRALIEALVRDRGGAAALKEVLAHAPMAPDQRSLMELLLSLDPDGAAQAGPAEPPAPDAPAEQRPSALERELADLREVNDTAAAALGACPACWGGDEGCGHCGGRGGAGSRPPDRALFRELVLPAVRRVRSLGQRAARPASRRPRTGDWRQSNEW